MAALSLATQQSNFLDLHQYFDNIFPLQPQEQHQQQRATKSEFASCGSEFIQMDQQSQHLYQQHSNNNNISNNNRSIGFSHSNNNNNQNIINNQQNLQQQLQNTISGNILQNINNQNRNCMSNFHTHIGADYTQVNYFVDSPPNSEESWTDEHSKSSPGPQIIDVQTLYTDSGSRKRRMDWDSLDIGQNENTSNAQNGNLTNKIQNLEKEKHKRDKLNERGWTDDIGFDLNNEFNANSYLSNETFLSFTPALNVLKQEPQTNQTPSIKINKSPLHTHPPRDLTKGEKVTNLNEPSTSTHNSEEKPKNDLNENVCGCGTQNTHQGLDLNSTIVEKLNNNAAGNGINIGNNNANSNSINNNNVQQQNNVIEANKIENITSSNMLATSQSDDHKFQYILAAATSIATKNNEETLTYLNQGQSYEIKLKKTGDLTFYRDKILKSVIKICFHERRLQFMEREQMQQWQVARPGERIIEVDVPLSYGLCHVSQPLNPNYLNTVEVFWDPMKEVGVYIKVNCISTEFTPKKHGGEKGVPFRLQIETYIENTTTTTTTNTTNNNTSTTSVAAATAPQSPIGAVVAAAATAAATSSVTSGNLTPPQNVSSLNAAPLVGGKQPVHAAACQIKVFKLKGADRKHKQDREKIQKRPQSEQEKFQPSYECTIMNDIPLDLITPSNGCFSPEYMKIWPNSPVHIPKYDGVLSYGNASPVANTSPIAINSVTSTNSTSLKLMDTNIISPQQITADPEEYQSLNIMPESTPTQVTQWLTNSRLTSYLSTFAHFSGADIMRMSKEDLIQICGLADGIRMFNILRAKTIAPRLTLYVSLDGCSYNAIYLICSTAKELTQKLFKLPGFFDMFAKNSNVGAMENGSLYNSWGMPSKYSGSGSNIFNDVSKSVIYISGPSGVHVTITDEVLNNEIKDGSLYTLEVQSGKVVMKLMNKNEN